MRLRERANEQRLADARHALQQAVAAREQPREHLLDHLVRAHDALAETLAQGLRNFGASFDLCGHGGVGFDHGPAYRLCLSAGQRCRRAWMNSATSRRAAL